MKDKLDECEHQIEDLQHDLMEQQKQNEALKLRNDNLLVSIQENKGNEKSNNRKGKRNELQLRIKQLQQEMKQQYHKFINKYEL